MSLSGLVFLSYRAGIHVGSVAVAIVSVGVSGLSGRIAFLPKFAGGVAGGYL